MEHGKVTSVNYENGVVSCSVEPMRVNTTYKNIPVIRPFSGFIQMPEIDEEVVMDTLDDGTRFIRDVIAKKDAYPEKMEEGEMAIQVDEDTIIQLDKREDGLFDLNLSASGDINVTAPKDEKIEDSKISITTEGKNSTVDITNEGKKGTVNAQATGNEGSLNVETTGNRSSINVANSGTEGAIIVSASGDQGSISISASGSGNISISGGQGNVEISANGDVKIDGIDFDQHVHDENGDGGGTTDPPKN